MFAKMKLVILHHRTNLTGTNRLVCNYMPLPNKVIYQLMLVEYCQSCLLFVMTFNYILQQSRLKSF